MSDWLDDAIERYIEERHWPKATIVSWTFNMHERERKGREALHAHIRETVEGVLQQMVDGDPPPLTYPPYIEAAGGGEPTGEQGAWDVGEDVPPWNAWWVAPVVLAASVVSIGCELPGVLLRKLRGRA